MYAQHVRKWSLKTQLQLMPLISLAISMLLLITCAPATTAAAASAAAETITHQLQRSWESEESSYYIALPQQQQQQQQQQLLADNGSGRSESVDSNIDNSNSNSNSNNNIQLSRLPSRPSSLSSFKNIKFRSATVFDAGSDSDAAVLRQQQQQQRQQHIAAVTTQQSQQQVPNTLINSQIYKLLYNNGMPSVAASSSKTRRHALQQQQQLLQQQQHLSNFARQPQQLQQLIAAYNFSSKAGATATATQRYFIESYEVPESSQEQTARNRRDFGSSGNRNGQRQHRAGGGHRQQQQEAKREHRRQRQQQRQQQQQHQQQQKQHQQHQHQQHRKHPQKHRNRQRAGRYCSARDPAQLAYVAPTVFMGVFKSMSADRRTNFSATMKVLQVYKQQKNLQLPQLVRLQFALRKNSGECDIYRERLLPRGLVRGNDLEQASDITYMMFVQQTNSGNFSILGQPTRVTPAVLEAVKMAVNETYAQNATITSLRSMPSNATMINGKELRIICNVEGRPPPKVTWFKDDKSINRKRNVYQFKHHKRRAELIVRSFNSSSDAGKYECRAKNKVRKDIDKRGIMINAYPVPLTPDPGSAGYPCENNHCFHGGTCMLLPFLNIYYCNCPEGFTGQRCEFSGPDNILLQSTAKYIP
ncbi:protein vein isoform X2 [Drosophila virilis]|uniref:protein vein isoform X2 n=1 Tax=Drosophila virilis TaxID=7244 RepID=UPI001395F76F|nr:protein vein isoform X2 [Drosophila virilis]